MSLTLNENVFTRARPTEFTIECGIGVPQYVAPWRNMDTIMGYERNKIFIAEWWHLYTGTLSNESLMGIDGNKMELEMNGPHARGVDWVLKVRGVVFTRQLCLQAKLVVKSDSP